MIAAKAEWRAIPMTDKAIASDQLIYRALPDSPVHIIHVDQPDHPEV